MSGASKSCPQLPVEDPCSKMHRLMSTGMHREISQEQLEETRTSCCAKLATEINELLNGYAKHKSGEKGLKQHYWEQVDGVDDPEVWKKHDQNIKKQQERLREKLDEFNKGNCSDKQRIPEDAWEWATRPRPQSTKTDEKTNAADPTSSSPLVASPAFMRKMEELTGLTGTALLVYVIISEGSRVFPPRNLVPVP